MPNLEPCPFCGGQGKLRKEGSSYYVSCSKCGARGTRSLVKKWHSVVCIAQANAIEAWNRRVEVSLFNNKKATKPDVINSQVSDEELTLINSYTRRKLTKDEVYAFSVMLCDNDIDRDGERFTVKSLFALEKLFVGKTGIIDHNLSAKNQTARIFSCSVEAVQGKKTQTGDDYFRLKARA
jgi:Lar family restriction alleviation protein